MPQFCDAGDTPTLTYQFENDVLKSQSFSVSPIDVSVYAQGFTENFQPGGTCTYTQANGIPTSFENCTDWRFAPTTDPSGYGNDGVPFFPFIFKVCSGVNPNREYYDYARKTPPPTLVNKNSCPARQNWIIQVKHQGSIIFTDSGEGSSRPTYDVACGCPPNQLDCGDCCLDCLTIFNQISDIRRLISRLK